MLSYLLTLVVSIIYNYCNKMFFLFYGFNKNPKIKYKVLTYYFSITFKQDYTTGDLCNQCKANTFNIAPDNQFGCISCFCMGLSNQCTSSRLYRQEVNIIWLMTFFSRQYVYKHIMFQVHATFARTHQDIKLIQRKNFVPLPYLEVDSSTRELIYRDFPPGSQEV